MSYRVPSLWLGRTVAVLASGPSLTREVVQKVRAAALPAVVTNRSYELAPWADALVGNDVAWWLATPAALGFAGLKLCLQDCPLPGVATLAGEDRRAARAGGNSGFAATWLAAKGGAERILLCGMDMRGTHWHGDHENGLRNTLPGTYPGWIKRFKEHAPRGVDIFNCTPGSALKCFPACTLDEALAWEGECLV